MFWPISDRHFVLISQLRCLNQAIDRGISPPRLKPARQRRRPISSLLTVLVRRRRWSSPISSRPFHLSHRRDPPMTPSRAMAIWKKVGNCYKLRHTGLLPAASCPSPEASPILVSPLACLSHTLLDSFLDSFIIQSINYSMTPLHLT